MQYRRSSRGGDDEVGSLDAGLALVKAGLAQIEGLDLGEVSGAELSAAVVAVSEIESAVAGLVQQGRLLR